MEPCETSRISTLCKTNITMENHQFLVVKSTINGHFQYVKLPEGSTITTCRQLQAIEDTLIKHTDFGANRLKLLVTWHISRRASRGQRFQTGGAVAGGDFLGICSSMANLQRANGRNLYETIISRPLAGNLKIPLFHPVSYFSMASGDFHD